MQTDSSAVGKMHHGMLIIVYMLIKERMIDYSCED